MLPGRLFFPWWPAGITLVIVVGNLGIEIPPLSLPRIRVLDLGQVGARALEGLLEG